jgi:hypothetical protein
VSFYLNLSPLGFTIGLPCKTSMHRILRREALPGWQRYKANNACHIQCANVSFEAGGGRSDGEGSNSSERKKDKSYRHNHSNSSSSKSFPDDYGTRSDHDDSLARAARQRQTLVLSSSASEHRLSSGSSASNHKNIQQVDTTSKPYYGKDHGIRVRLRAEGKEFLIQDPPPIPVSEHITTSDHDLNNRRARRRNTVVQDLKKEALDPFQRGSQNIDKGLLPGEGDYGGVKVEVIPFSDLIEAGTVGNVWSDTELKNESQPCDSHHHDSPALTKSQIANRRRRLAKKRKKLEGEQGKMNTGSTATEVSEIIPGREASIRQRSEVADLGDVEEEGTEKKGVDFDFATEFQNRLNSSPAAVSSTGTSSISNEEDTFAPTPNLEDTPRPMREVSSIPIRESSQSPFLSKSYAHPFTRFFVSPQAESTPSSRSGRSVEGGNSSQTSYSGLLSSPYVVNQRPKLRQDSQSIFAPPEDYDMMDNDPTNTSRILEIKNELLKSKRENLAKPRFVAVIVDADQLLFLPQHLNRGREGAIEALQLIKDQINRDLGSNLTAQDIRIQCFCNYRGLTGFLKKSGLVPGDAFQEFVNAFQSYAPFNVFVAAGDTKQAADTKVKAFLADFIHDDSCLQIYLGGLGDYGYRDDLNDIRKLGLLHRIRLLNIPAFTLQSLHYDEFSSRMVGWGNQVFVLTHNLIKESPSLLTTAEYRLQRVQELLQQDQWDSRDRNWFDQLLTADLKRLAPELVYGIRQLKRKIAVGEKVAARERRLDP